MPVQIVRIDEDQLGEQERNALDILVNLDVASLNQLKQLMELSHPGEVGPQTLASFVRLCGDERIELSDTGVNAFKEAHSLGNRGPLQGVIGPQTAATYFRVLMDRVRTPEGDDGQRAINDLGLELVKEFEGLHQRISGDPNHVRAYLDPVGIPTIGYGHTAGVHMGQIITITQANVFLEQDLQGCARAVSRLVKVELNDNQFSALVSFTFNLGAGNLGKSTLLKRVNERRFTDAANEFLKWVKAGGKTLPGLVRRRKAERALFLA